MSVVLHSVAIFVTDIDRAREFYEQHLGMPVAIAGSFGFELLSAPPHIGVHPATHDDAKALVGRHTGITLEVRGLFDLCARLSDAGVHLVAEPAQQSFGVMALVADPDGNVLALWEDNVSAAEEE